ncbi:hypothetical protein CSB11_01395 [Candidatus Campbellbacteria bacterium]|nr:MAG: hypothetical protein CSB11_01395 [Candidatus Campbellbacteria bacterium]
MNFINFLLPVFIFCFLIFFSLLPSEVLKKTKYFQNKKEFLRKLSHFLISCVFIGSSFYLKNNQIYFFAFALLLGILVAKNLKIFSSIFKTKRKTFGIVLFPISLTLSTLLFLPQNQNAFIFGMLVLGISDSLAAVLGKNFGKKEILKNKTYVGSFAFLVSTFLITLWFLPSFDLVLISKAFFISLSVTFVELLLKQGLDNIFIPLFSASLLILLI